MVSAAQMRAKRIFDILGASVGLVGCSLAIAIGWAVAAVSTQSDGLFRQTRVGFRGRLFLIVKLRTMRLSSEPTNAVTTSKDPRVTRAGWWLRRAKIDELPQLLNVLRGDMSLVGPRPDVPGWADRLEGRDRIILSVRPGLTGPASIRFRHEEELLATVPDPEAYNRDVIFPEKVRLNRDYVENYSFFKDLKYLWLTICGRDLPGSGSAADRSPVSVGNLSA